MKNDPTQYLLPALKLTGAAALVYTAYHFMQKFGIFSTAEEREAAKLVEAAGKDASVVDDKNALLAFNPNYRDALIKAYKAKTGKTFDTKKQLGQLTYTAFADIAFNIKNAKGTFKDDNNKLYGQFRRIQTQFQLSDVSSIFNKAYKQDLLEYIRSFTNPTELAVVLKMVKGMPQYL